MVMASMSTFGRVALRIAAAAMSLQFAATIATADAQTVPAPSAAPATSAPTPNPDDLFAAARTVLANQRYPSHITYSIVVRFDSGDDTHDDIYNGSVDGSSEDFRVDQFSDKERANPATPHGTNISVLSNTIGKVNPGESIWIPDLSPIYSFGLRRCPTPDRSASGGDAGAKTIGRVVSANRTYNVFSVGPETIDGAAVTHLALQPISDPNRYRLRDVWINAANVIVQARTSGNFTARATEHVPWIIRFKTIAGANYVESETSEEPVSVDGRTFDTVTVLFYNIGSQPEFGFMRATRNAQLALPDEGRGGENLTEPASSNAC
jgi:hypothetical protein